MPPAEHNKSRLWISFRRWCEIVFAAILSAIVVFLFLEWQLERLLRVSPHVMWGANIAGILGLAWCVGKGWTATPQRSRRFSKYPPPWAAGVLGAGLLLFTLGSCSELRRELALPDVIKETLSAWGLGCVVIVPAVFLFSLISLHRERAHLTNGRPAKIAGEQQRIEEWTFDQIVQWLKVESPIKDATNDMFGRQEMAERIARRLCEPSPQAQAIVGQLGSGKSSLRNLVANCIASRNAYPQIRMAEVELWPFATSTAAVDAIIQRLIDELAGFADVTALRGLPAAYTAAMTSAGGLWAATTHLLLGTRRTHQEILNRIDDVATAIGVRLVLWVEDLERFCNSGILRDGDAVESPEDTARLGPIRALLNGLESPTMKSITVVTATTTLRNRFDLEKIARFVETLPELEDRAVARVLGRFRKGCRSAKEYIDPASSRTRKELDLLEQLEGQVFRYAFGGSHVHTIRDALLVLCRTPRTLKQGLRQCLDIWDGLAGEIDFDDVLVMSLLRVANPDAFALASESRSFQCMSEGAPLYEKIQQKDREAWNKRLEDLDPNTELRDAVHKIAEFVFEAKQKPEKPQGFAVSGHADYWLRFLSQSIPKSNIRDQEVLRVLFAHTEGDSELLDCIENPNASSTIVDFAHLLLTDRATLLLVQLVKRRAGEDAQSWPGAQPPGLATVLYVWIKQRMHLRNSITPQVAFEEIKKAIAIAVPRNLSLAVSLENYFVMPAGSGGDLIFNINGCNQPAEAKFLLRTRLREHYVCRPDDLAHALHGAQRPTLFWLCWGLDRAEANDMSGLPFEGWDDFAVTVLDATKLCPETMLPQLFDLVTTALPTRSHDATAEQKFQLHSEIATRLFGSVAAVQDVVRNVDVDGKELEMYKSILLSQTAQSPPPSQDAPASSENHKSD